MVDVITCGFGGIYAVFRAWVGGVMTTERYRLVWQKSISRSFKMDDDPKWQQPEKHRLPSFEIIISQLCTAIDQKDFIYFFRIRDSVGWTQEDEVPKQKP